MKKDNNKDIYNDITVLTNQEVIKKYDIDLDGLSAKQVEESLEEFGPNVIDYGKGESVLSVLFKSFFTPFTIVLLLLAVVSFFTDYAFAPKGEKDLTAVFIIVGMVCLSGFLSFFQTRRSNNAAEKLKSLVNITTNVKRKDHKAKEMSMQDTVKYDIIYLAAGDMIPADMRILQAKDLFISQSSLSGESNPVEKTSDPYEIKSNDNIYDYENLAFMGSNVVSGSAIGCIINVGSDTYFGDIATKITEEKPLTNFDKGINSVSWLLIRFMAIMVPVVFLINGFAKGDWISSLLFALSIAVGLTPEMLPMIVTTNLSKGSVEMAKQGTIIKNLNSVQSFGAVDVLCTDKTGTLTQDKIVLEYHWNLDGVDNDYVLKMAYFNSYYQTGLKNLMDVAIIKSAQKTLNTDKYIYKYDKVDEIPFDFDRRRMSVVIKDYNNKTTLITKGAIEELMSISTTACMNGQNVPLDDSVKAEIQKTIDKLARQGFRVIGLSTKENPPDVGQLGINDENDMTLIGILAFLDPPKDSARAAIEALHDHNVKVKVITGDNELVTKKVCADVGLDASKIYYGNDIEDKTDEELRKITEEYDIFVKVSPIQKTKIVSTIKNNGHVVAYMGDGINDAMAMKAADVGISVDTAVDIAKESADVILLKKDLMVLEKGIVGGRKIFGNTIKYIKMTASSNFGNMFSVLVATIFLPFLPMLPLQILVLNLIYDISCISLPWDNVDNDYLKTPKKWDADSIKAFMIWFGPTSSIFDIITYAIMYFIICPAMVGGSFHTLDPESQAMFIAIFHTGWFIESLWTQTFIIHVLRTPKIPLIQSHASFIVTVITTIGILIGTALAYTPFHEGLGMMELPLEYFIYLIAIVAGYFVLTSIVKHYYVKKYKQLL